MLDVNDIFPEFRLIGHHGKEVTSDYKHGSWYLIYWYPKADTPGCTAQAQGLRDQIEAFEELDCVVLGVSFDLPEDNAAFASKYKLPFTLLSDPKGVLAHRVGAFDAELGAPSRIAHLVDSSGRVRRAYVVEAPGYFAEMVLDDLEAMGDCDPNE
ncbi:MULTISPECIES: peroxiredoxin [Candidatus Microthrix]|mgnify:FL=1|uniref:thioredoxin-dependent peroxiredoxin n=1 Tax=Candidatus Neomicrothrix parvicella RN1 TaxID=1229780 RepID=R4Z1S7_9ACTN|nr:MULTISPECIES: peroxiredoxin [Microthrix]MBP9619880.1 peroxiredoxin [Candidatus Microthrix sp.]CCM64854.1 putative peroxiredoxin YgaF [Candidatus Microthrix parvicella RN1]HMS49456.1 peroxiredoxin [Candidatus Microthrix sp.]